MLRQDSKGGFHRICAQLEAEHSRVVKELQAEINELRRRLTINENAGVGQNGQGELGDDGPDTTDGRPGPVEILSNIDSPGTVEKKKKAGQLMSLGSTDTLEESLEEDEKTEARYVLLLIPRWMRCCGVSATCVGSWLTWWNGCQEPPRVGPLAKFVAGQAFQSFILCVILCNTLFIIRITDADMAQSLQPQRGDNCSSPTSFGLISDVVFTSVYVVELILKLGVHRWYFFVRGDWKWNNFDAFLVFTASVNLLVDLNSDCSPQSSFTFLRALRVLKSARVLRMLRVVRFVRELRLMLDCVVNSMLHLVWCVVLIGMMLLMFALYIMQGLKSHVAEADDKTMIEDRFDTVANTMVSLLMATTGGVDWSDQYDFVAGGGTSLRMAYLFYIAFFTMVAWNIVMSSFVEKASRLGMPDIEATAMEKYRNQQNYVKELARMLRRKLDADGDGTLSLEEFKTHIHDPDLAAFCLARDINVTDVDMFFHMLSSNGTDEVDIATFSRAIVRLRGSASAIDMQSLHFDLKSMQGENHTRLSGLEEEFRSFRDALRGKFLESNCNGGNGSQPFANLFSQDPCRFTL